MLKMTVLVFLPVEYGVSFLRGVGRWVYGGDLWEGNSPSLHMLAFGKCPGLGGTPRRAELKFPLLDYNNQGGHMWGYWRGWVRG